MGDPLFAQEVPGENPAGTRIRHRWMVVPHQAVMPAIHQHGKDLPPRLHLPDQDGIAIAHVDKVQYQHANHPLF